MKTLITTVGVSMKIQIGYFKILVRLIIAQLNLVNRIGLEWNGEDAVLNSHMPSSNAEMPVTWAIQHWIK
jgi:hypothetical protein